MTRQTNMLDQAAEILADYIDHMSTKAAEALLARGAPFAANVSQQELRAFYQAQLFNPDGSVNAQGRMGLIQKLGAEGFGQVFKALTGSSGQEQEETYA